MKKYIAIVLMIVLLIPVSVAAEPTHRNFVNDLSDEISDADIENLNATLYDIGEEFGIEAIMLCMQDLAGEGTIEYAERYHSEGVDDGSFYDDAILFIINNEVPEWYIYTGGRATDLITADDEDALWEAFAGADTDLGSIHAYIDVLKDILAAYVETTDLTDATDAPEPTEPANSDVTDAPTLPANTDAPVYLVDERDFLTIEEQAEIDQELARIGETYGMDPIVLFIQSTGDLGARQYAKVFFEEGVQNGTFRKNGVVLIWVKDTNTWASYRTDRATGHISEEESEDLWAAFGVSGSAYDKVYSYLEALEDIFIEKGVHPYPETRVLPRLVDEADLLTDAQEKELLGMLDEVSERQKCDLIIALIPSKGNKSVQAFSDDFYDDNGYGYGIDSDGILFMLITEERDQVYTTTGFAINAFSLKWHDYVFDQMSSDLKANRYYEAFKTYISVMDSFLTSAKKEDDSGYWEPLTPDEESSDLIVVVIMFGVALLLSAGISYLIVRSIEKKSSGGVEIRQSAAEYVVPNSLNLTVQEDIFMFSSVSKSARAQESSSSGGGGGGSHRSSSGSSHGGSSRKY